jgi:hypothetical protein
MPRSRDQERVEGRSELGARGDDAVAGLQVRRYDGDADRCRRQERDTGRTYVHQAGEGGARPLRLAIPLDPHARAGDPLLLGPLERLDRPIGRQPIGRGVEVGQPGRGWNWARMVGSTGESTWRWNRGQVPWAAPHLLFTKPSSQLPDRPATDCRCSGDCHRRPSGRGQCRHGPAVWLHDWLHSGVAAHGPIARLGSGSCAALDLRPVPLDLLAGNDPVTPDFLRSQSSTMDLGSEGCVANSEICSRGRESKKLRLIVHKR